MLGALAEPRTNDPRTQTLQTDLAQTLDTPLIRPTDLQLIARVLKTDFLIRKTETNAYLKRD